MPDHSESNTTVKDKKILEILAIGSHVMNSLKWIHWSLKETFAIFKCLDYKTSRKIYWYHWCSPAHVILICFTGMLNLILLAQTVIMTATWQYPPKLCFMITVVKMLIFIVMINIYMHNWPQFGGLLAGFRCFS